MKNILLIGCGLLGSSLLRRIHKKKIAKKIFVYEKSKKNISKIKKLRLPGIIVNKLSNVVSKSELIIFCTPMSEYKKLILKINKGLTTSHIITDIGSSKLETMLVLKKNFKKMFLGLQVTQLLVLKLADQKMVNIIYLRISGVF